MRDILGQSFFPMRGWEGLGEGGGPCSPSLSQDILTPSTPGSFPVGLEFMEFIGLGLEFWLVLCDDFAGALARKSSLLIWRGPG